MGERLWPGGSGGRVGRRAARGRRLVIYAPDDAILVRLWLLAVDDGVVDVLAAPVQGGAVVAPHLVREVQVADAITFAPGSMGC